MKHGKLLYCLIGSSLVATLAACAAPSGTDANHTGVPSADVASSTITVTRRGLGDGLYELAYSPRQSALFVASAGNFGEQPGPSKVLRLAPESLAPEAEIPLGLQGFGVALDDANDRLYVGHSGDAAVTVIDTNRNEVIGIVKLADKIQDAEGKQRYPHNFRELVVDSDQQRLYLPGFWFDTGALYVVDTKALKLEKVVPGFGPGSTGIALDAAGQRLFVSNLLGQLFEVDTRSLEITNQWDSGSDQPLNVAFDSRSKLVYAVDQGSEQVRKARLERDVTYEPRTETNRVVVFDPAKGLAVASLPSDKGLVALLVDQARDRLFVTNRESGTVTVFDISSNQLLHRISLPKHPNSLALDKESGAVFVSIKNPIVQGKTGTEDIVRIELP